MTPAQLPNPIAQLGTLDGYRCYFMDADYWTPYLRILCERHGGPAAAGIRIGLPGTYPTFIVDDQWVIKLFGILFDGAEAFAAEHAFNRLLRADPEVAVPALLHAGQLFDDTDDWHWPYLIFEYVPGVSIGEVYEQIPFEQKCLLAEEMGRITRRLHALPLGQACPFGQGWKPYRNLLRRQKQTCLEHHRAWGSLPGHLLQQLERYLMPIEALIDPNESPILIHADLTKDHVLGTWDSGCWQTHALIDFGDAMVGDLCYELVALHLDLFDYDKRLLRVHLEAYGVDDRFYEALPEWAMNTALLHRFNVFEGLMKRRPDVSSMADLTELAASVFDLRF